MGYRIALFIAALIMFIGNITHVWGEGSTMSSGPLEDKNITDIFTELSSAGTLVILILYIVFDFLKNRTVAAGTKTMDKLEKEVLLGGGSNGPHSLVTTVALIKDDIDEIKEDVDEIHDKLEHITRLLESPKLPHSTPRKEKAT